MTTSFALDHLVVAVQNLPLAVGQYEALGFIVVPGGKHTHAPTQNALVYLADGAYFELIEWTADAPGEKWFERLRQSGNGLVDFALVPNALADVVASANQGGATYTGPVDGSRLRPDGEHVRWQLAWPASDALPFLCGDLTPRALRVPEGSVRVHRNGATGIASIAVRVRDLPAAVAGYRALLAGAEGVRFEDATTVEALGLVVAVVHIGPARIHLVSPVAGSQAAEALASRADLHSKGEGIYRVVLLGAGGTPRPLAPAQASGVSLVLDGGALPTRDQIATRTQCAPTSFAGTRRLLAKLVALGAIATAPLVHAADLVPVRFEQTVNTIFFLPQHVALAKGFYKDAGLDVKVRTSQGSDKAMAAVLTGSADIALLGPETVVYVHNSESPLKPRIFAGLTATDGFLVLARTPDPKFDVSKFAGKEVLGFRPGSTPDIFLAAALRKKGLDPRSQVRITSNIAVTARAGAWLSGRGDYAVFLEPEATQVVANGGGHIVASLGQQVGLIDYTVYAASDDYIKANPSTIQAWTQAVLRAQQYTQRTDAATLAKEVVQFFPGLTPADIEPAIARYKQYGIWKATPRIEPAALDALQTLLVDEKLLDAAKRVGFDALATNRFADRAK